ncbi:hypothetical protein [Maricaulis sp.]|uniref:hypothetical protein n=1 Tax=Maricaulis sp. TaxID=1486257 RepID=UPI001B023011|nr:hypothetical protein [Maricaulis sp.]MBO6795735.1 hypothetical protein [Maricaulis sp.]
MPHAELDPKSDRYTPMENLLYRRSPFGFWGTTIAIFVISFGSFLLICHITQRPPIYEVAADGSISFPSVVWIGFVLSMILTSALSLSENGVRLWRAVEEDLVRALKPSGENAARAFAAGVPVSWRGRYLGFFAAGALAGLGFNAFMIVVNAGTLERYLSSIGLWFLVFAPFLYGLGVRAGVDVARESSELKTLVRDHLQVDLYHLDRLHVLGRIGLRAALSWLLMAAVLLLFVAAPSQMTVGLISIGISIAGGMWVFWSAVKPAHEQIREAKSAELERIHERMALLRDAALAGDVEAASALAGLTDYEQWIEQRPEWPLSPSVTQRFALYILIPVLPIIASYLFEKVADLVLGATS